MKDAPLGQLIISSPENIRNLEQLRQEHILLCDPSRSDKAEISKMPVFIKLGYGIHGNESSAQNASALVAYYLTAGEGKEIDELLEKCCYPYRSCPQSRRNAAAFNMGKFHKEPE